MRSPLSLFRGRDRNLNFDYGVYYSKFRSYQRKCQTNFTTHFFFCSFKVSWIVAKVDYSSSISIYLCNSKPRPKICQVWPGSKSISCGYISCKKYGHDSRFRAYKNYLKLKRDVRLKYSPTVQEIPEKTTLDANH